MPDNRNSTIATDVIRKYETLKSARSNWDTHWRQIAERVMPTLRFEFESQPVAGTTKGEERNEFMFDSTASIANGRFASIMDSLLTPRNSRWHRLQPSNPRLKKNREVRLWFEETTRVLFQHRYATQANFASQNNQIFEQVGAFGNGIMFIDELKTRPGLRYKICSLGGIYLTQNHQGIVDGVIRHFKMTARQIVQKWPDTAPPKIKEAVDKISGSADKKEEEFEILHCVLPREDVNPNRKDFRGMPHVSYYITIEGKVLLEERGYRTFPYAIARHKQAPNEVYGRSPAMEVLPSIKTLNEQKKTLLKQGHRSVDPVLLMFDDGAASQFSLRPGAENYGYVSKEGRPMVHTLPIGDVAVGKDMMDMERADINDVFMLTLFQILTESPTKTATEVLELVKEKGILLAPSFSKQESEYLGPTIARELDVLDVQNLLPPQPQILIDSEGDYEVEYDSPFSKAQRAEEAVGLMRTLEFALDIATKTGDTSVLDYFDMDVIIPDFAHIQGMPEKFMRARDKIEKLRKDRDRAEKIERAGRLAPGAAAMANAGAKIAPEEARAAIAAATG